MKAGQWIKASLRALGVQAANQPVKAVDFETGVFYANSLMASYDNLGFGYAEIDSADDEITIPPYANLWAVYALANRLSPEFGPNEGLMELAQRERDAYREMLTHIDLDISMEYSSIVPTGSGNGTCGPKFYPGTDSNLLLNEQGDYILLED